MENKEFKRHIDYNIVNRSSQSNVKDSLSTNLYDWPIDQDELHVLKIHTIIKIGDRLTDLVRLLSQNLERRGYFMYILYQRNNLNYQTIILLYCDILIYKVVIFFQYELLFRFETYFCTKQNHWYQSDNVNFNQEEKKRY